MITISQHHKDGLKKRNLKPMGKKNNNNWKSKMHTQHCQVHVPTIPRAEWNALHSCWDQASQLATVSCGQIKVGRCNESLWWLSKETDKENHKTQKETNINREIQ
jgi:hypothetical protein